ncbi:MAG: hypothetical protein Q8Q50_13720 [Methylobacter sp.]|jgi:hypothetical protein|nr:hypothetical protein [Methylobacter sp.]
MLPFKEKLALQRVIAEQNKILATNPESSEKLAAIQAKSAALMALGICLTPKF